MVAMKLPPESALILLCAVYAGCEYGGRISAILINVPGDAGAVLIDTSQKLAKKFTDLIVNSLPGRPTPPTATIP